MKSVEEQYMHMHAGVYEGMDACMQYIACMHIRFFVNRTTQEDAASKGFLLNIKAPFK